jgi:hypothetical protein
MTFGELKQMGMTSEMIKNIKKQILQDTYDNQDGLNVLEDNEEKSAEPTQSVKA